MSWPPLPTSPPSMGCAGAQPQKWECRQLGSLESLPTTPSPHPQMLLGYANATQRGLEFMDFLEDELTYKTLFVPVNKGFVDNMVTAGPWAVCSSAVGPTQQVLLCS